MLITGPQDHTHAADYTRLDAYQPRASPANAPATRSRTSDPPQLIGSEASHCDDTTTKYAATRDGRGINPPRCQPCRPNNPCVSSDALGHDIGSTNCPQVPLDGGDSEADSNPTMGSAGPRPWPLGANHPGQGSTVADDLLPVADAPAATQPPADPRTWECPLDPPAGLEADIIEALYTAPQHDELYVTTHSPQLSKWPYPAPSMQSEPAALYDAALTAASTGTSPPGLDHTTALNFPAWNKEATGHLVDPLVLNGIVFGFPIQYVGPPVIGPTPTYNHQSADTYPIHVDEYIDKELRAAALSGPYTDPPFTPWFASSPIMTREKSGGQGRRIIVDLSYPDGGVNQFITPHVFNGRDAIHNLPTIDSAVASIAATPPGDVHLAVVDLSRAYRQFPVTPLDWPLLGIYWRGAWSFDRRLPFGCRMSSFIMQSIAEFIVRALQSRSVTTHMYLDDILMISPTAKKAERDFASILTLLDDLGLEVATHKLQRPSPLVCWLGININIGENHLSIPASKLGQIKDCMAAASRRSFITKKHLQRLIGLANHITKVVRAARVFICRLLAALRAAKSDNIRVTDHVRADLRWYARHLSTSDGRAFIPVDRIVLRIWADACLKGAGASDGTRYYEHLFGADFAAAHHIVHLEATNCMAVVRAFVDSSITRDDVLAACTRALWFHTAAADVDLRFTHIPGESMALPDALSRASINAAARSEADKYISRLSLRRIRPDKSLFGYKAFS